MLIHIMGPAGAGASTLGREVAKKLGFAFLDTDICKWKDTEPAFLEMRPEAEANEMLLTEINKHKNLIIAGSLHNNPQTFKYIDAIVFLHTPKKLRLKRVINRDVELGRNSLKQKGEVKKKFKEFLWYVKNYEKLGSDVRSKKSQENLIKACSAKVAHLDTIGEYEQNLNNLIVLVEEFLK